MVFEFSLHWLVQQLSDAPAWTQANKSRLERGFASNHCARTLLAYLKCATGPHAGWWPLTLSYSDSPCVLMQMCLGFQGRAFSPICQNPRSQVKGFFDLEMRFIIIFRPSFWKCLTAYNRPFCVSQIGLEVLGALSLGATECGRQSKMGKVCPNSPFEMILAHIYHLCNPNLVLPGQVTTMFCLAITVAHS